MRKVGYMYRNKAARRNKRGKATTGIYAGVVSPLLALVFSVLFVYYILG
jgi:hypothetical protein